LSLGFFCGLFWVFFSGSRVFLLGFLVGFGLGPLGVFFFFFFFVLALATRVYLRCTRGALRFLINLLTYQKKINLYELYKHKHIGKRIILATFFPTKHWAHQLSFSPDPIQG
jgi:hypothetical protein